MARREAKGRKRRAYRTQLTIEFYLLAGNCDRARHSLRASQAATMLNLWSDPVWSKVIATVIVSVPGVFVYFAGWWPAIVQAGRNSTAVPNWLLAALGLCIVACMVLSTKTLVARR
jgi:hypothetical protein